MREKSIIEETSISCEYCGDKGTRETPTNGIYICDKDKCAIAYCDDQCEMLS